MKKSKLNGGAGRERKTAREERPREAAQIQSHEHGTLLLSAGDNSLPRTPANRKQPDRSVHLPVHVMENFPDDILMPLFFAPLCLSTLPKRCCLRNPLKHPSMPSVCFLSARVRFFGTLDLMFSLARSLAFDREQKIKFKSSCCWEGAGIGMCRKRGTS